MHRPSLSSRTAAMLTEARRLEATGDPADAARAHELCWQAVLDNDSLARRGAHRWGNRAVPYEDRAQTARLGLLTAAERFDPGRGTRFSTMAMWWVRAAIMREHPEVATSHKDCEMMRQIRELEGHGLNEEEIAGYLNLTVEQVRAVRSAVYASHALSLDAPLGTDPDAGSLSEVVAAPEDERYAPEDVSRAAAALKRLPAREREVMRMRYGLDGEAPTTLTDTGRRLGVSKEQARRLEARALLHLQQDLRGGEMASLEDRLHAFLETHPGAYVRSASASLGVSDDEVAALIKPMGLLALGSAGRKHTVQLYLPGTKPVDKPVAKKKPKPVPDTPTAPPPVPPPVESADLVLAHVVRLLDIADDRSTLPVELRMARLVTEVLDLRVRR